MSGDYYSYEPLARLDRHLALAGFLGDENRLVAYELASLSGLPVASLDRKIEHRAGRSVWELAWREGEESYRRHERIELERELGERPFGILALGDGTLIDEDNLERVLASAHLVALDRDLANVFWALKSGPLAAVERWHPLYSGALESRDQIEPFYRLRAPGLGRARHRVDMAGKRRSDAVAEILDLLTDLAS